MASDKYETTGTIHAINEPVTRGGNNGSKEFTSRKIHIKIADGAYPQTVEYEVGGKSLGLFDGYNVGDEVKVEWNLRGREWTDPKTGVVKVFNTLSPWKVERVNSQHTTRSAGGGYGAPPSDDNSDIPF